ncbi:dihydrodipicolinate synthase family protein [Flammeovirgaceae bacterium SG7u.111]|nr:dihydrodipicolinate synthase family protein [Flammeovirgaceae bacterium SG7u.132]WPO34968.1 dihydrodipicolinate synthase family protein [Flammeovirgaceae bacterium SG7u.111]
MNNYYSKLKNKINGPVFSIMTPFKEDESIDFASLEKYLEKIHEAGGNIFYVMGYNSRYSQLSWEEIKTLNQFVSKKVKELDKNHIMIVADPLHCSTKTSIEFANHAEKIGADMISLIVRERFYSEDQIFNHYNLIAQNSSTAILIHEMPFLNGYGGPTVNWPISLLDRLADLEHVVAVKEDAKDDAYSKDVVAKLRDRVSIVISGGGKRQWLRFADIGCQAWLNGIGVFEPKLATLFWQYYQNGNKDGYMKIIEEVEVPFFERGVQKYSWHLTIKAALEARGIMKRKDRMPLQELGENEYKIVQKIIQELPIDDIIK